MSSIYWFVGAMWNGSDDQLSRFLREGVWQSGYSDRYLGEVRSMAIGERIAVKATFVTRKGLPFENHGRPVSTMEIKATGTITGNAGDGRTVQVEWDPVPVNRRWYFFTSRAAVWKNDLAQERHRKWREWLIAFTFEGKPQPIESFLNDNYWQRKYQLGSHTSHWIPFYKEFADRLVAWRDRRPNLVEAIYRVLPQFSNYLRDDLGTGEKKPLSDIDPFTVMGIFNRQLTASNRQVIAERLGRELGVTQSPPDDFSGIPVLSNMNAMLFAHLVGGRKPDDIDTLWQCFEAAIGYADDPSIDHRDQFIDAFDRSIQVKQTGVAALTMGLFWARPETYAPLDSFTMAYVEQMLDDSPPLRVRNGSQYLSLLDNLVVHMQSSEAVVETFAQLTERAWNHAEQRIPESVPYTVESIIADGSFHGPERLQTMVANLRTKKNLILQGPPGTGKTWLARRLAYALIGEQAKERVTAIQFHPNLSYEDFVRGFRPAGDGRLALVDGPFLEAVRQAKQVPEQPFVVIVEEVNRGNPAQIFGEMLTLVEATKRRPVDALRLAYGDDEVWLPENLYLVGTMNLADRSLAIVDFALRRRFAFVNLEPCVNDAWQDWMVQHGNPVDVVRQIRQRIEQLNVTIESDPTLGRAFRVGHSFVTPASSAPGFDLRAWYRQVVETEIQPLLEEYWFDNQDKVREATQRLLSD